VLSRYIANANHAEPDLANMKGSSGQINHTFKLNLWLKRTLQVMWQEREEDPKTPMEQSLHISQV